MLGTGGLDLHGFVFPVGSAGLDLHGFVSPAAVGAVRPGVWAADNGVPGWTAGGSGMSAVLTSGVAQKAAGDTVRMPMDFGNIKQLIAGYSVVGYSVVATGLTVTAPQLDYPYQLSAVFSGGVSGTKYDCVFTITLNDPDATVISRTGVLSIL